MEQKTAIINGKKYTVTRNFNMVLNYHFTDKNGLIHLVDGEDVREWVTSEDATPGLENEMDGLKIAIAYARYYARKTEGGAFWWKIKQ